MKAEGKSGKQISKLSSSKRSSGGVPWYEQGNARLAFKRELTWKEAYQRNNKSRDQKNLRCFPNCSAGFGHQDGFCGQSVKVVFECDPAVGPQERTDVLAVAEFAKHDSPDRLIGSLVTLGEINNHGTTSPDQVTHMEGLRLQGHAHAPGECNYKPCACIMFEFNKNLKGWHYGFLGSKKTRNLFHVFRSYVLIKTDKCRSGEPLYQIIAGCVSPPWQMYCRRRKHAGDVPPPEAPARATVSRAGTTDCVPRHRSRVPVPLSSAFWQRKTIFDSSDRSSPSSESGGYDSVSSKQLHALGGSYNVAMLQALNAGGGHNNPRLPISQFCDQNALQYMRRLDSAKRNGEDVAGLKRRLEAVTGASGHSQSKRRRADSRQEEHEHDSLEHHPHASHVQAGRQRLSPRSAGLAVAAAVTGDADAGNDNILELTKRLIQHLDLPNPLQRQKVSLNVSTQQIEGFCELLMRFMVLQDRIQQKAESAQEAGEQHLPPEVAEFLENDKGLPELDHFCVYVCTAASTRVHDFLTRLGSSSADVFVIAQLGLQLFTELVDDFLTSTHKGSPRGGRRGVSDDGSCTPNALGLNSLGRSVLSSSFASGDFDMNMQPPTGGLNLEDLDWSSTNSTPRETGSSSYKDSFSHKVPGLFNLTPTHSFMLSPASKHGGYTLTPKHSFTLKPLGETGSGQPPPQQQQQQQQRRIDTDLAVPSSPMLKSPAVLGDADKFIADTGDQFHGIFSPRVQTLSLAVKGERASKPEEPHAA